MSTSKQPSNLNQMSQWILIIAVVAGTFGIGFRMGEKKSQQKARTAAYAYTVKNLDEGNTRNLDFALFWEAWNKLEDSYVDKTKLDPQKMYYGAIRGMVASVGDTYTFFLSPDENKESKRDLEGKFYGIGAELGLKNNQIVVVTPLKNSPAEKAGLRAGDYIIKVDGKSTQTWTLFEAVNKIRGKKGTKVVLTVLRENSDKNIDISVMRDEINVPFIELKYEKDVAIVQLSRFGDPTNDLWDKAVDDMLQKKAAGKLKGVVIDVRGNPGGYLMGAVHVASEFLKKDTLIVKQEYADKDPELYLSQRDGRLIGLPVVMLQNKGSASASEIVAGALRDTVGAKLVGEYSFGKGTVQTAEDLSQGAGIHITISKWVLPKEGWIQTTGLKPDVAVENTIKDGFTLTRETDTQLDKALELLVH